MKVHSPNAEYSGRQVYGETVIEFVDGEAEVDELSVGIRQYFADAGYVITREAETTGITVTDGLDERTVEDLKGYAVEHGVDLGEATRKGDIVAAIRVHFAAIPDTPPTPA